MPRNEWQHVTIKCSTHKRLKRLSVDSGMNIRELADDAINKFISEANLVDLIIKRKQKTA